MGKRPIDTGVWSGKGVWTLKRFRQTFKAISLMTTKRIEEDQQSETLTIYVLFYDKTILSHY